MPVTLSSISSAVSASVLGPAAELARPSRPGDVGAAISDAVPSRGQKAIDSAARQATQEMASAKIQLSSVGRVRSAFAEARDAARAVQAPADTSAVPRSAIELRTAANRLVDGVNGASRVSTEVARPANRRDQSSALIDATLGRTPANAKSNANASDRVERGNSSTRVATPSPEQQRVQQAGNSLNRAVGAANTSRSGTSDDTQALAGIGITVARDGQISLDRQRFDAAVDANRSGVEQTLGRLGQRVEAAANGQLSEDGNIGKATASATRRVDRAETRQGQLDEAQRVVQQRAEVLQNVNQTNNPFLVGGVTAYRGVFSL